MVVKRGSYSKSDLKGNKLVKKARQSDVRRDKIEVKAEKQMKSAYEYSPKQKREMKMTHKKIAEDQKREARRDDRYMAKKK